MIDIELRPATPADAPHILWLEEVCMKDYARALWGNWHPSDTLQRLDIAGHEMITLDGQPLGCGATRRDTNGLRVLNTNSAKRFYERHGFRTGRQTTAHFYMVFDTAANDGGPVP